MSTPEDTEQVQADRAAEAAYRDYKADTEADSRYRDRLEVVTVTLRHLIGQVEQSGNPDNYGGQRYSQAAAGVVKDVTKALAALGLAELVYAATAADTTEPVR